MTTDALERELRDRPTTDPSADLAAALARAEAEGWVVRRIRTDRTVDLGVVQTNAANNNVNEGSQVILSSQTLTDFVKNHPDNIVTIFVVDDSSGSEGQKRFASKECNNLDGETDGVRSYAATAWVVRL